MGFKNEVQIVFFELSQ